KESKKIHKTIQKQQYENFTTSRSEGLDKTYDIFQKLICQLEIHGEVISQEDANIKLLRSLPPDWNTYTLIMRNKSDLDTLSMDYLYNNLKVSSTNEAVNTAHNVSAASSQGQASASTYADDVISHAYHEGEQIHKENRKETEFQWQRNVKTPANALVITDGMGYNWSYQAKTGPTDFALMTFSSSGSSSSDTETRLGYDSQLNERDLSNKSDVFESAADSSVNKSEEDNNQANKEFCSNSSNNKLRYMTGNKSFLTDYQEINRGFAAFGGNPKGGKISGKGKIRTGKFDFEDVYFVKELKFNLFSVSQMCDNKNSVLFTETECLVLSPDFKLPDENQVLLKVPRHNNMYSFDLKNVVPS
nr:ribonuclease H-like domain-containing protein [Tanacetum cinerariifolium]